jgi:hypothetical protein
MVVALLPKANRKANGNSSPSKGSSANADIASSISTAFMPVFPHSVEILIFGDSNSRLLAMHSQNTLCASYPHARKHACMQGALNELLRVKPVILRQ